MDIVGEIKEIARRAKEQVGKINSTSDLLSWEKSVLGRKGRLSQLMRSIKDLPLEQRREAGHIANQVKQELQEIAAKLKSSLQQAEKQKQIDVTWPGKKPQRGHLHPVSLVQRELEDIFASLGFIIEDGPELESEYYNFDALNIPAYHPARDMQDTFFTVGGDVLRTHTSPIQVRAMQKYGAPLRLIAPGRVFRYEASDASHDFVFHQVEGLMIDKYISIANLIAIAKEFLSRIFAQDVEVRVRPGFFPFVEPGFEMDLTCVLCQGKGCSACKRTGWMEFMGAGLVHPRVLEASGIDPREFSGFAFGFGLDRLIMLKYRIDDIRLFHSGDIRFLQQF